MQFKSGMLGKKQINEAAMRLKDKSCSVCLVVHTNPDGDAIGSALGLYHHLTEQGYENVSVLAPNEYASFLHWLPGNDKVIIATVQKKLALKLIADAHILFCLDFNGLNRAEGLDEAMRKSPAYKILIDHHPQPANEFDLMFSDTSVSSTAELLYEFIAALNGDSTLSLESSQCLYAGIVTDTGSFSYGSNNPRTYEITARLIEKGVDGNKIHQLIYNTYSEKRMRLLGYCLSEKLEVMHDQGVAFISLTEKDLQRFDHQEGDTEGVVNYALSIEGISLAALFMEKNGHVKISLRSTGEVNVNELARKYFNGGGHKNAAGGKSFNSMESTLNSFRNVVTNKGVV